MRSCSSHADQGAEGSYFVTYQLFVSLTTISGLPRSEVITPVAHSIPLDGIAPTLARSLPQTRTMNTRSGYGLSRLMNVDVPRLLVAVCSLAILPHTGPPSPGAPKAVAKKGEGKGRAPAAPVTAATVIATDMPVILTAPGTVEPFANVAVKTRVDGQIIEVLFKEGDLVEEGSVLFRLDDRLVKAQIAQAEASIAKDQALLRDAEATLQGGKLATREVDLAKVLPFATRYEPARFQERCKEIVGLLK